MNVVFVANDNWVADEEKNTLEAELRSAFEDRLAFKVIQPWLVDLSKEPVKEVADRILKVSPCVLLIDVHSPGSEDGAVLLDRLRKSEFPGFAYFWTAANPEADKLRFASLLGKWGGGAFNRRDPASFRAVASDIFASWEHFHSFEVEKPQERQIANALDAALRVLCELQHGLWTLEAGSDGAIEKWRTCVARSYDIYAHDADGFCSLRMLNHPKGNLSK